MALDGGVGILFNLTGTNQALTRQHQIPEIFHGTMDTFIQACYAN